MYRRLCWRHSWQLIMNCAGDYQINQNDHQVIDALVLKLPGGKINGAILVAVVHKYWNCAVMGTPQSWLGARPPVSWSRWPLPSQLPLPNWHLAPQSHIPSHARQLSCQSLNCSPPVVANLDDHYQRHNHNHYYIQQNHDYQNQPNKSTISTARSWWPTWATAGQLHAYMALRGLSHRSAFIIIIIIISIINNKTTIPLWLVWCRKLHFFGRNYSWEYTWEHVCLYQGWWQPTPAPFLITTIILRNWPKALVIGC